MIYVKEYYCGYEVGKPEYIGLTCIENEAEAFAYVEKQKEVDIFCDVYDEAYFLGSTIPITTPEEITEEDIAEMSALLGKQF